MKPAIESVWRWYGRRNGWLRTNDCTYAFGDMDSGDYGIVFRGTIPPGAITVLITSGQPRPLLWNRRLSNAELGELSRPQF